jgi:spore germination protein Q
MTYNPTNYNPTNYSPTNYNANEQNYYSFPAYRAVVGSQNQDKMMPTTNQMGAHHHPHHPHPAQQPVPMPLPTPTPAIPPSIPAGSTIQGVQTTPSAPPPPGLAPLEQSFIENILRFNLGKVGTFYMTYENNTQWNAKVFRGKIEAAGRDHIIISDTKTGMRYLLLMVNLDYVTFDEELNYTSPYQVGTRR